ncbi:MAG: pyridoxal phosphate-dependent aminotransferase [Spirochaetes bacterium]|nr:pyridoxal phosphate-dependent aminotransferase [Spirochaetota bacterium]
MKISNELNESLTLKFAQTARSLKQQGRKIISLGLGEPDFETPEHIIDATHKAMLDGFTRYSDSLGLQDLRLAVSEKLNTDNKCKYEPGQIVITPGAKQAIYLSLCALLEPEDEVINFTPFYVSYVPMAKIAEPGCVIHHIKMNKNDFSIDFEYLESKINSKTKVILLNSPNNPSGKIFNLSELEKISQLAVKYNLFVISDEIYEKLCFGNEKHISIASLPGMNERTFLVNGFSKAYSMTGWRIGYVACPKSFISNMNKLQQHINTNTCTFVQKGALAALNGDNKFIEDYGLKLQKRFDLLKKYMAKQDKIRCFIPQAGFFAFADISELKMPSNDFCSQLLEKTGVAITPGIACGKDWDDHIRISLAAEESTLASAFDLLLDFINKMDN